MARNRSVGASRVLTAAGVTSVGHLAERQLQMLGYGQTSKPVDESKYAYKAIAYDLNSLLDECGVPGKVEIGRAHV